MAARQLALSIAQLNDIHACLVQLGQQAAVHCAMLADLSGQEIVHWDELALVDMPSIAALAAGDLLATIEIGRMLGGTRGCNLIVQEHVEQTILMCRVGEGLLLLLATARNVPLGWSRLAIKRTGDHILAIVDTGSFPPPPLAVSDDFAANFAAQIESIW